MKPRLRPPNYRLRLHVVVMVLVLAATGLIGKALAVQILGKDFYQAQGDARHLRTVTIPAYRGMISDRNGEPLAVSTPVVSLWADPRDLLANGPERVPELARELGIDEEPLMQRLVQRAESEFVYLKRHMSPQDADQIINRTAELDAAGQIVVAGESFAAMLGSTPEALVGQTLAERLRWPEDKDRLTAMLEGRMRSHEGPVEVAGHPGKWRISLSAKRAEGEVAGVSVVIAIPGVHAQREFRRYYPAGEALAHVIGYTDIDDRGQEGLELAFEDWLAGKPGSKRVLQDRRGHRVEDIDLIEAEQPGKDLVLSIDRRIQYLAYRELKAAIAEHGASSGSVVVIDVPTGEVLAMVNQPSYNPNQRDRQRGSTVRNRAATDVFEPGSTIKPFTVVAALESGKFKPGNQGRDLARADRDRHLPGQGHPQFRAARRHRHHHQVEQRRLDQARPRDRQRGALRCAAPLRLRCDHRLRFSRRIARRAPGLSPLGPGREGRAFLWLRPVGNAAATGHRLCRAGQWRARARADLRQGRRQSGGLGDRPGAGRQCAGHAGNGHRAQPAPRGRPRCRTTALAASPAPRARRVAAATRTSATSRCFAGLAPVSAPRLACVVVDQRSQRRRLLRWPDLGAGVRPCDRRRAAPDGCAAGQPAADGGCAQHRRGNRGRRGIGRGAGHAMSELTLGKLLDELHIVATVRQPADLAMPLTGVALDTREIRPGDVFLALRGASDHGYWHAARAIEAGAAAILAEAPLPTDATLPMPCRC
jgi:PAS domain-containing protein